MTRRAIIAAAVLALCTPGVARAYECKVSESYSYVSLSWTDRVIKYGVRSPGSTSIEDQSVVLRAIEDAFTAWTEPECTDIAFAAVGVVVDAPKEVSQVVFVQSEWRYDPQAVALTRTTYGVEDGVIRAATIEVNEQIYKFRDVIADGCIEQPPTYDLTAVLTHEVGHLIGLDHTKNFDRQPGDPTMAPEVDVCETEKRTLEQDDIEGLCTLYPKGEPAGHCVPLPITPGSYVSNTPFGCRTTASGGADASLWVAALAVIYLRSKRSARA